MRRSLAPIALALCVLAGASACSKAKEGGAAPGSSAGATSAATVADFPKKDVAAWINGAPVSLAEARGAVVLVEAWGPA